MSDSITYDENRYDGYSIDQIIAELQGPALQLLKRGTMATLIARREVGGLLVAASKLVHSTADQIVLFRQILDIHYKEARRHMKLWVFWPRIATMLMGRDESCRKRGVPFVVPGYLRCLKLAGITHMPPANQTETPPPPVMPDDPPTEVEALLERLAEVELQNRLEREKSVRLTIELDMTREEVAELKFDARRNPEPGTNPTGWLDRVVGWAGIKATTFATTTIG